MSTDVKSDVRDACALGEEVLNSVHWRHDPKDPREGYDGPMRPFWVEQADCILFYQCRKTACVLSRTGGDGFIIRRMPTERPDLLQWSAPCFVRLGMTGVGISFGVARIASFMACLTPTLREDLIKNGGRSFGGVDTAVIMGSQVVPTADFAPGKGAAYGLAGGNKRTGMVFDLSLEVGSLTVDQERNHTVYGAEATAEALLSGRVPPPAGMQQLYGRIGGIVNKLERVSAAPSLTRSSLDRATLGTDPDNRET